MCPQHVSRQFSCGHREQSGAVGCSGGRAVERSDSRSGTKKAAPFTGNTSGRQTKNSTIDRQARGALQAGMNSTTDRQATNRGVEITPVGNQLAQAPRLEHVAGEDMRAHLSSAAPQSDLGQVYMAGDRLHHVQRVKKWDSRSGQTWSGLLGQDYVKVGQRLNEGSTRLLDWDSLLDQNSNARCKCPIAELSRLGRSLELVVLPSIQSAPIQSRSIPFSTIQSPSALFNPSHRYYFCNSARGD